MSMKLVVASAAIASAVVDQDRLTMIKEINAIPGNTWKAGVNPRFEHEKLGSASKLMGVKLEDSKAELFKLAKQAPELPKGFKAPDAFDSETNWPECAKVIGDIRDQSNCGCCWAFGAAEAASDRACIASNATIAVPLSAQETCFCASSNGCDGGTLFTPWQYIKNNGLVTGGLYNNTGPLGGGFCSKYSLPHCHHHGPQGNDPYPAEGSAGCPSQTSASCPRKCDSDAVAPHNDFTNDRYSFDGEVYMYREVEKIQNAIMTDGPVEAAFTVYADFENYVSGVYQHKSGQTLGGHAIRIVGWGTDGGVDYWKVANSWNPYWGENGYFRIKRGSDECGIEDQVTASSPGSSWSKM